jgi:hypothetical protein
MENSYRIYIDRQTAYMGGRGSAYTCKLSVGQHLLILKLNYVMNCHEILTDSFTNSLMIRSIAALFLHHIVPRLHSRGIYVTHIITDLTWLGTSTEEAELQQVHLSLGYLHRYSMFVAHSRIFLQSRSRLSYRAHTAYVTHTVHYTWSVFHLYADSNTTVLLTIQLLCFTLRDEAF